MNDSNNNINSSSISIMIIVMILVGPFVAMANRTDTAASALQPYDMMYYDIA